jgi:hypothetical protein
MRKYKSGAAFYATCNTLYTLANTIIMLVKNRLSDSVAKFARTEHTTMHGVDWIGTKINSGGC